MSLPDLYNIDALFTEEERMVRDSVRVFVADKIMPGVRQWNREDRFLVELVPGIAQLGMLGADLKGYVCAGLSYNAYGLMMQELERGDSGFRSFVSVQNGLVMYPIFTFGSQEQKDRWLPNLATGEAIGCFGLTEPDFGSNPAGIITTAKKDGKHWILNG